MKKLLYFPLEPVDFVTALAAFHPVLGYFNVSGLGMLLV